METSILQGMGIIEQFWKGTAQRYFLWSLVKCEQGLRGLQIDRLTNYGHYRIPKSSPLAYGSGELKSAQNHLILSPYCPSPYFSPMHQ